MEPANDGTRVDSIIHRRLPGLSGVCFNVTCLNYQMANRTDRAPACRRHCFEVSAAVDG